jgi:hypothetical protein
MQERALILSNLGLYSFYSSFLEIQKKKCGSAHFSSQIWACAMRMTAKSQFNTRLKTLN